MPALELNGRGRVKLARDGLLAGVTFAMGGLLTLVFPSATDFDRNTAALPLGAYATAYLEVLVKANPRNWPARVAFVRQLQGRGDFARAVKELDAVPRTDETRAELDELSLDLSWAAMCALPKGSPALAAATAEVVGRLENLARSSGGLVGAARYANIALQVERPLLAARFFEEQAATAMGEDRAAALERSGRWLLAGGEPARAAERFDAAAKATSTRAAQGAWARESLAAAEAAGNAPGAAERASEWVTRRPHDLELLAEAARLSLAANRPRLARDLGRRLMLAKHADPDERERQALRELAAGDPESAWPLVEEAARRHPASAEWREREAQTAEWTGRPRVALRDWLWLSGARRQQVASLQQPQKKAPTP